MAYNTPFAAQPLVASSELPLTLISLDDWVLVTLTGADRVKYLQGQVTADID
ncbi:tRNA-modifying protein YgfZ, partial [Yersinia enterocolitica]